MTIKPFLNIHSAFSAGPNVIESTDLVKGLVTVVLMALSSAPFSTFQEAFQMSQKFGNLISQKNVPRVYDWIQARTNNPRWSNGTAMKTADADGLKAKPFPI